MARKYEYRKESISTSDPDMMDRLNRMGQHGWHVSTSHQKSLVVVFILARKIPKPLVVKLRDV